MDENNKGQSPQDNKSQFRRNIWVAGIFMLLALLSWYLMRDSGPNIKPESPAAQLLRDDAEKQKAAQAALQDAKSGKSAAKEARLFIKPQVAGVESKNGEWRFSVIINLDEEKCSAYAGSIEQCRELWAEAKPAPESWKLEPRLPMAFKTFKDVDSATIDFSVPMADLPDPVKYKTLTLTLPRFAPKAEQEQLEVTLPPWIITPKVSRVFPNPESPSKLIIQASLESSRPLDRESVEKKIRFFPEGEELALGKPQIRWSGDYSLSATIPVLSLPLKTGNLTLILEAGAKAQKGAYSTMAPIQSGAPIPSRDEAVGVASLYLSNMVGEDEVLRPLIIAEFSLPVHSAEAIKSVSAKLLPLYRDAEDEKNNRRFNWSNLPEIPADVLKNAPAVPLKAEPVADEFASVFAFRYKAPARHYIYIEGQEGLKSRSGHVMQQSWSAARAVPQLSPELRFMQDGNILALSGTRKLALSSRGLDNVEWRIFQAKPDFLALLAGKSAKFTAPELSGYPLDMEDISDVHEGAKQLEGGDGVNPQYSEIDLGELLAKGRRGIFQINLQGKKDGKTVADIGRFVLLTDLGLVIKKGIRGERSVFVTSLAKGGAIENAEVRVIARNSVVLLKKATDKNGRADLPALEGFVREKEPVAIEVRSGTDMTYMKLADRESRITTGLSSNYDRMASEGINVFAFSERGVYRPGETLRFGLIAKDSGWNADTALPPLSVRLLDPLDNEIAQKNVSLTREGFGEVSLPTQEYSPTGRYNLLVSLGDQELGSAGAQVEEFQPDRIKVSSRIIEVTDAEVKTAAHGQSDPAQTEEKANGKAQDTPKAKGTPIDSSEPRWLTPNNLRAEVLVNNLYGAPVRGGQVKASFSAHPATEGFIKYEDFYFSSPVAENAPVLENELLSDLSTDEDGVAQYTLPAHRLEEATYLLSFTAEGFEAGGGRSVIAHSGVLVSPFKQFIGWRAATRLNFLPKNSTSAVDLIALGRSGKPEQSEPLTVKIVAIDYKSVLTRIPSGVYRYETQRRVSTLREEAVAIPAEGLKFNLPTATPGDFEFILEDARGIKRNSFAFTVAGAADRRQGLKRDATLRVKLDKENYNAGEEIKVFVSAPYAGSGLITLESDRVLGHKWFHTNTSDSVQTITAPADFEGRGFLMVHMLRDLGAGEIYANPASHAITPFMANMDRRDIGLTLETPEKVIPGEAMTIAIKAKRAGKVLVFAVDEGILQLTRYKNPSPLTYFLRDKTHEVAGMRNWHLLMPEYGLVRKESAFGGGFSADALNRLNPFRRKGEDSVVYWSGLVDVGPQKKELQWTVPPYFNGQLRVMAVAAAKDGVGETAGKTLVNAPVIITPTLPVAVAPGDSFDVTVTLANTVEGSGKAAPVTFAANLSEGLAFESEPEKIVPVDEGHEGRVTFRLKALEHLGESTVNLSASIGEANKAVTVKRPVTLSVRPAAPRMSTLAVGRLKGGEQVIPVARDLYPQLATIRAGISGLPLPLASGLAGYLIAFPHGCTEQILSSAFPYALLRGNEGLLPGTKNDNKTGLAVERGVQVLRERRLEPGRYALWPQQSEAYDFLSVYALDYLLTAKEAGFATPQDLLTENAKSVRAILLERPRNLDDARLIAYAAWVYTRAGALGIGERFRDMSNLVKHCDQALPGWRKDISAALLAGVYNMLKQNKEAEDLLKDVAIADPADKKNPWVGDGWFINQLWANGLHLNIIARHFPERLQGDVARLLLINLVNAVSGGQYTTTGAVQAIRGIASYAAGMMGKDSQAPAIVARDKNHQPLNLQASGDAVKTIQTDSAAEEFVFSGGSGLYWQIFSDGFDRALPAGSASSKIQLKVDFIPVNGGLLGELKQGDEVDVRVRASTTNKTTLDNVAITTLLPGGFEMLIARGGDLLNANPQGANHSDHNQQGNNDRDGDDAPRTSGAAASAVGGSISSGAVKSASVGVRPMRLAHAERREDRMVLYATLNGQESEYTYRIKAVNKGKFTLPAAFAEALYDPDARARTGLGVVEVR